VCPPLGKAPSPFFIFIGTFLHSQKKYM
jgi:hypothetical protein